MKKSILLLIVCIFLFTGCVASNAQKGAGIGGLAGMAGSALGKGDRKTTMLLGLGGSVLGYLIGNEVDKSGHSNTPTETYDNYDSNYYQDRDRAYRTGNGSRYNQNDRYQDNRYSQNSRYQNNGPQTDCEKIVTRRTENGLTVETIEETCTGRVTVRRY